MKKTTNLSTDRNGVVNKKRSKSNSKITANSVESDKSKTPTWYPNKKISPNQ